jgi:hypothetical protein
MLALKYALSLTNSESLPSTLRLRTWNSKGSVDVTSSNDLCRIGESTSPETENVRVPRQVGQNSVLYIRVRKKDSRTSPILVWSRRVQPRHNPGGAGPRDRYRIRGRQAYCHPLLDDDLPFFLEIL